MISPLIYCIFIKHSSHMHNKIRTDHTFVAYFWNPPVYLFDLQNINIINQMYAKLLTQK